MKIATSHFVYWGVAVFMPEKVGNLQGDVMNEAQTREDLINPAIRAAGWTKANNCQMLVEQSACEFAPVPADCPSASRPTTCTGTCR